MRGSIATCKTRIVISLRPLDEILVDLEHVPAFLYPITETRSFARTQPP